MMPIMKTINTKHTHTKHKQKHKLRATTGACPSPTCMPFASSSSRMIYSSSASILLPFLRSGPSSPSPFRHRASLFSLFRFLSSRRLPACRLALRMGHSCIHPRESHRLSMCRRADRARSPLTNCRFSCRVAFCSPSPVLFTFGGPRRFVLVFFFMDGAYCSHSSSRKKSKA